MRIFYHTAILFFFLINCFFTKSIAQSAIDFGGTNAYVTFGNNAQLGLQQFTLGCWFKREGTGISVSTGAGGLTAIPLMSKGRAEADGSNLDMNYFLGIQTSNNTLAADFEEITGGPNPGLNHPVAGVTPIALNTWYHAAVTYDGNEWRLYLNGSLDASLVVAQTPQSGSIQHAGLASAMNSTGTPGGYFDGLMDEVRIWNTALTQAQIQSNINSEINAQVGLVARWGMNEGVGTLVGDISGNNINGTIINNNYLWQAGAPFNINIAPDTANVISPLNNDSCQSTNTNLTVNVTDANGDAMTVKFYARPKRVTGKKFTLIPMPDTQFYSGQLNGGTNSIYKAQCNWIVSKKDSLNIAFVSHLGDCTQNADNGGNNVEWERADTAMKLIEDPILTGLIDGIPYGMNVGNHDQSPFGNPAGTTIFFNQYFGENRFVGRSYWGGKYRSSSDNSFQLFSASGMDFIVIDLEYDPAADPLVLAWADSLLLANSNRRAIISSHNLEDAAGAFSAQGLATYNALKARPNLFLMLCGHVPNGEATRTDTYLGNTVFTLLSDYQSRTNGGDGWLRIMEFNPATNSISVKTYSPTLNQYEIDVNSQFNLPYNMQPAAAPWQLIGTNVNVPSGSNTSINFNGLLADTTYEWFVTASDGMDTTASSYWCFKSNKPTVNLGNDTAQCGGMVTLDAGNTGMLYQWSNGANTQTITVNTTGTYSVTVNDTARGCNNSDTVLVTINQLPIVNLGTDTCISLGATLVLDAGAGFNSYSWNTGANTSSITVSTTDTFYVTVIDGNGCIASDTIIVCIYDGINGSLNEQTYIGISPNPFNESTTIQLQLTANKSNVKMIVYNIMGTKIVELENGILESGSHTYLLNAVENNITKGIYTLHINVNENLYTRKIVNY